MIDPVLRRALRKRQAACRSHDDVLGRSIRGFGDARLLESIRCRPGSPLLALLARRLRHYRPRHIERRVAVAVAAFDATRGRWSLDVVPGPEHLGHRMARRATGVMPRLLYIPVYPGLPPRRLRRLAEIVVAFGSPLSSGARLP